MSSSTTDHGLSASSVAIIKQQASAHQPLITTLMLGTVFSSMLIPLFIALLVFSTKQLRQRFIFRLVLCDVCLCLALGFWNGLINVHAMLSPLNPFPSAFHYVHAILVYVMPWVLDLALLLRMLAMFPPRVTSLQTRVALFTFPIVLKAVRFIIIVVWAVDWFRITSSTGDVLSSLDKAWNGKPYIKADSVLQIFDTGFLSALFLYKVKTTVSVNGRAYDPRPYSLSRRIRALFWVAATNFVLPVILNIIQAIVFFASKSFWSALYIMTINVYVSVIGIVFATVWSGRMNTLEDYDASVSTPSWRAPSSRPPRVTMSLPNPTGSLNGINTKSKDSSKTAVSLTNGPEEDIEMTNSADPWNQGARSPMKITIEKYTTVVAE